MISRDWSDAVRAAMAMMRYWAAHGSRRRSRLRAKPARSPGIAFAGDDSITVDGKEDRARPLHRRERDVRQRDSMDGCEGRSGGGHDLRRRAAAGGCSRRVRACAAAFLSQRRRAGDGGSGRDRPARRRRSIRELSPSWRDAHRCYRRRAGRRFCRHRARRTDRRRRSALPRYRFRRHGRGRRQGQMLLPGLWEMHTHSSGVEFGPALLAAGSPRRGIAAANSTIWSRSAMPSRSRAPSARACCSPVWSMPAGRGVRPRDGRDRRTKGRAVVHATTRPVSNRSSFTRC